MSQKWSRIIGKLETSEGRGFEYEALPFLRAIWGNAIAPKALGTLDKSGIDIVKWKPRNGINIPVAIQCKGFSAKEPELGENQIKQCKKSINTFRKSPFTADLYIMLVNRYLKSKIFRDAIKAELEDLKKSGKVKEVFLWSFQDLIKKAHLKIRELCYKNLALSDNKIVDLALERPICAPLEKVPLEISRLIVTPNKKETESVIRETVGDPAEFILDNEISNISLILAKAGYGKTTSAFRSRQLTSKNAFYLSAATLPQEVNSRAPLLKNWIRFDNFWENILPEDVPLIEELVSLAIDLFLKDPEMPVVLILDALDESIYFSRLHGLQNLFSQVSDIRVPVVLLAREEFWVDKQKDFFSFFGLQAQRKDKVIKRNIAVIRLKDWGKTQIAQFAKRYRNTLDGTERENVEKFVELVNSNRYEEIYGDIPKRPLFLNYILESVAQEGIKRKGRARLFYEWVKLKIRRDVKNPILAGGEGRISILQNQNLGEEEIIRLSFKAMKVAAASMIITEDNQLDLLPSCDIEEIKAGEAKLALYLDSISLFLHSLLEQEKSTAEIQTVRFTHRTYQEFFLALYIRDNLAAFKHLELPESIKTQLSDIQNEGI